ncbi:MAG: hypothetical protein ABFS56_23840 [Pseudomonadota bacterium]
MVSYTSRRFQAGDEEAINGLYEKITGRKRSIEQYRWQWQEAPGGKGEIWLIEAEDKTGKRLIGHHGLMPIRFTCGETNLIVGKTENTMVLKNSRKKILYPRFEQRFFREYQSRFDAFFSTMGPQAAIRMRKALGYSETGKWEIYTWNFQYGSAIKYYLEKQLGNQSKILRALSLIPSISRTIKSGGHSIVDILDNSEAAKHPFFETFWNNARNELSVAPRRDKEDLEWRFWNNPYNTYKTILFSFDCGAQGYAIVNISNNKFFILEDIHVSPMKRELWMLALKDLAVWCIDEEAAWLRYITTSDGHPKEILDLFRELFDMGIVLRTRKACIKKTDQYMPRCISPSSSLKISTSDWNITGILFEGRK